MLAKAQSDDNGIKSVARALEEHASEPLRFFDALNKGTFLELAEEFANKANALNVSAERYNAGGGGFVSTWK